METQLSQRMGSIITDTIPQGDTESAGVSLQGRPILGLILPPTNDTPAVTFEVSIDGGVSWLDLLQADGATQAVTLAAAATAHAVSSDDLTPLAAYVDDQVRIRVVASVAQTSARTFAWIVLG